MNPWWKNWKLWSGVFAIIVAYVPQALAFFNVPVPVSDFVVLTLNAAFTIAGIILIAAGWADNAVARAMKVFNTIKPHAR